jgi:hypothetical protein
LPWELGKNLVVGIVSESASETDGMLARAVQVKINLSDNGVIAAMTRRVKSETTEV